MLTSLAVRIQVSPEVAVVLSAICLVVLGLLLFGAFGRWLRSKMSDRTVKIVSLVVSASAITAGVLILNSFLKMTDQYHPVYQGLALFDLEHVILVAFLLAIGSVALVWGRLSGLGAVISLAGGALILAKPIKWPLESRHDGEPYDLFSETHLYFVLSGGALALVGVAMIFAAARQHKEKRTAQARTTRSIGHAN